MQLLLSTAALALGLAAVAIGSPTNSPPKIQCSDYTDTFDNYTILTGLLGPGFYQNNIFYQDFTIGNGGIVPALGGVASQSQPNVAYSMGPNPAAGGNAATLSPFGYMTTNNTNTKYFSLYSFYYGCETSAVQTACAVEVIPYGTKGQQLGSASFLYIPAAEVAQGSMTLAVLPLQFYQELSAVEFIATTFTASSAGAFFFLLDNVYHSACH